MYFAVEVILFNLFIVANSQITLPTGEEIFPVSCYLNILIILDRSDSVVGGFNVSRNFVLDVSEELEVGPFTHSVIISKILLEIFYLNQFYMSNLRWHL